MAGSLDCPEICGTGLDVLDDLAALSDLALAALLAAAPTLVGFAGLADFLAFPVRATAILRSPSKLSSSIVADKAAT